MERVWIRGIPCWARRGQADGVDGSNAKKIKGSVLKV